MAPGYFQHANDDLSIVGDLGPTCYAVFSYLRRLADKKGICYPGHQKIADTLRLSFATVKRSIAALKKAGHIQITFRSGKGNEYRLADLPWSPVTLVTSDPGHS